jgi:hypothetical protein
MSRVRGNIRDRQTMRSFVMGGIVFDSTDLASLPPPSLFYSLFCM